MQPTTNLAGLAGIHALAADLARLCRGPAALAAAAERLRPVTALAASIGRLTEPPGGDAAVLPFTPPEKIYGPARRRRRRR